MTAQADIIRDRRRAFAGPGGSHDRLIGFLGKALPAGIGAVPTGTFSADRIVADLGERTVTLEGNARLRMTPGKLRMPN